MVVTVYMREQKQLIKKLNALSKKASSYGVPFNYSFSNERKEKKEIWRGYEDGTSSKQCDIYVTVVDLEIPDESIVKSGNWEILAMLEHGENGNIVTAFTDESDIEWRTLPPKCDHCNSNRFRKTTFIVRNSEGEVKQVGKACLKDYTGISPYMAISFANFIDSETYCDREVYNEEDFAGFFKSSNYYSVDQVLAAACKSIDSSGYIKSGEANSTKESVIDILHKAHIEDKYYEKASKIKEWLKTQEYSRSDLIYNLSMIVLNGDYVAYNNIGRMAYAPVAYNNYLAKQAEMLAKVENSTSEWVGEVGKRMSEDMVSIKCVTSYETEYGVTFVYVFIDKSGNEYVWFASNCNLGNYPSGAKIAFTVKKHTTKNGIKQTVVNRCRVVEEKPAPASNDVDNAFNMFFQSVGM